MLRNILKLLFLIILLKEQSFAVEESFKDKIRRLSGEKDKETEIWHCVFSWKHSQEARCDDSMITDPPPPCHEALNSIIEAYKAIPLITAYNSIEKSKVHLTLCFKIQPNAHHAGLIIEYINGNEINALYYDLAIKEANSKEISRSGNSGAISGSKGEYKVREESHEFIVSRFLWSPKAPHHEVDYYTYKTFIIDQDKKFDELCKRLHADSLKDSFPYHFFGKNYDNCITYIAQAFQEAGIINNIFGISVFYYAGWLKGCVDILKDKGEKSKEYTLSKTNINFITSNRNEGTVITALIKTIRQETN